jgi:hypothetical protein
MLGRLTALAGQVAEAALSIVGIRIGTEEPPYNSEPLTDNVELRHYGPRIAAETTVAADEDAARNEGFRRLAGYIFGKNQASDTIAMTAPVGQSGDDGTDWSIRFFMPSKWTMQTLPAPDDDRVRLTEVPAETFAVLSFTGDRGPDAVRTRTVELREALRAHGIEPIGDPTAWFYDRPWTLPCRRRNEIAIPIST